MNDRAEWVVIITAVIALCAGVLFIATLPFAGMGWAVLTFAKMFVAVNVTYINCFATGIVIALVALVVAR